MELTASSCKSTSLPREERPATDGTTTIRKKYSKKKRGKLPPEVVRSMKKWLRVNYEHAYPSAEEKMSFRRGFPVSERQISDWFINARCRYVPKIKKEHGIENVTVARNKMRKKRKISTEGACPRNHGEENYNEDIDQKIKSTIEFLKTEIHSDMKKKNLREIEWDYNNEDRFIGYDSGWSWHNLCLLSAVASTLRKEIKSE